MPPGGQITCTKVGNSCVRTAELAAVASADASEGFSLIKTKVLRERRGQGDPGIEASGYCD